MIDPTEAQVREFFDTDQSSPVIFVNCHRYYSHAKYADDFDDPRYPTGVSGYVAYHRYLQEVETRFFPQVGGRFLIAGKVDMVFIGDGKWDEIIIGHYPSKADAMRMTAMPGYDEIVVHRLAGLMFAQTLVLSPEKLDRLLLSVE